MALRKTDVPRGKASESSGPPLKGKASATRSGVPPPALPRQLERQPDAVSDNLERLRARAEELLSRRPEDLWRLPVEDVRALVHELYVRQVELEMQNEELRFAQLQLERSRSAFFRLFDCSPVGYLTLNMNAEILQVNASTARLLGVDKRRLSKVRFTRFIAPESQDDFHLCYRRAWNVRSPQICEVNLVRKVGAFCAQLVILRPSGEVGDSDDALVVVTDVTDRVLAMQALQQSEKKYHEMLDMANVGVWHQDGHHKVTYVNSSISKMLGYRPEEMIGREPIEFMDAESRQRSLENRKLRRKGIAGRVESRLLRKDGGFIDVLYCVAPLMGVEGSYRGQVTILTDITERRRAENEIEARNRFLEIANSASEMKPLLDQYVAEVGKFSGCSSVAVRILDAEGNVPYHAYQGFSRQFHALESPLSLKDECMCMRVISGHSDPTLPYYTVGGSFYVNGTTRLLATVPEEEKGTTCNVCNKFGYESVALVPIRRGDRLLGLIHVADQRENMTPVEMVVTLERAAIMLGDAIEQVRAQELLARQTKELELRAAELDAANKELDAFASSAAHDLRGPLVRINGFSRVLAEDYGDSLDEKGKDLLDRVAAASLNMSQRVDSLLRLARMGRGELHRCPVDLSELARDIADGLKTTGPERQVEFIIAPQLVGAADPHLLRAVMENLLGNAWKYTSKHAQAKIEFGMTEREGQPVYYVRDDGAGFDMAYAVRLFGPFQRLHSAYEFSGEGIGLATVRRIILRHGGRIWAEGAVEQGATFYFTLPATQDHEALGQV